MCSECTEKDLNLVICYVKNRHTWGVKNKEEELFINRVIDFKKRTLYVNS